MANDQVKIEFKTSYDGKGADQAAQGVKKVEDEAKKSSGGFSGLADGITKVSARMEILGKLMRGLGVVSIIMGAVSAFTNLKRAIEESANKAKELADEKKKIGEAKQIEDLKTAYDDLSAAIARANTQMAQENELLNEQLKSSRSVEDAKIKQAEEKDLAGVSSSDPDMAEKQSVIRAGYARKRGLMTASREKEDVILQRQEMKARQEKLLRDADAAEAEASKLDIPIASAKLSAQDAETRSTQKNGITWKSAFTGKTYDDYDAQAADRKKAMDYEQTAKGLEAEKAKRMETVSSYRSQATHLGKIADAKYGGLEAADIRTQTEDLVGTGATTAATSSLTKKQADRDAEAKAVEVIRQRAAALGNAKLSLSSASASEQQATLLRDKTDTSFHSSGSRNVLQHERVMAPLQSGASQATAAREKAEKDVAVLENALKNLMDAYGAAYNKMAQDVNRAAVQQKLDASGN